MYEFFSLLTVQDYSKFSLLFLRLHMVMGVDIFQDASRVLWVSKMMSSKAEYAVENSTCFELYNLQIKPSSLREVSVE